MLLQHLLILAILGSLLVGCVSTGNDDGLERMQRNHNAAVQTAA